MGDEAILCSDDLNLMSILVGGLIVYNCVSSFFVLSNFSKVVIHKVGLSNEKKLVSYRIDLHPAFVEVDCFKVRS